MRDKIVAAKNRIQNYKTEITVGTVCTLVLVVAIQHDSLKYKDRFLAVHNLLDEYYTEDL
jgi:hypothetical protein